MAKPFEPPACVWDFLDGLHRLVRPIQPRSFSLLLESEAIQ